MMRVSKMLHPRPMSGDDLLDQRITEVAAYLSKPSDSDGEVERLRHALRWYADARPVDLNNESSIRSYQQVAQDALEGVRTHETQAEPLIDWKGSYEEALRQRDALQADANRYRWLRENTFVEGYWIDGAGGVDTKRRVEGSVHFLDKAIDMERIKAAPGSAQNAPAILAPSEAASFDKALSRSPRRIETPARQDAEQWLRDALLQVAETSLPVHDRVRQHARIAAERGALNGEPPLCPCDPPYSEENDCMAKHFTPGKFRCRRTDNGRGES